MKPSQRLYLGPMIHHSFFPGYTQFLESPKEELSGYYAFLPGSPSKGIGPFQDVMSARTAISRSYSSQGERHV